MTTVTPVGADPATIEALGKAFGKLGKVRPVGELASMRQKLTGADRVLIVDQALIIIEQLYTHLHMKRVRHAIDPAQALRVLRDQAAGLGDLRFHSEMLRIFKSLRDIHTAYTAPPPFAEQTAFLPFLLEPCTDAHGTTRYLVTRVLAHFDHPTFRPGVEITHWHGAPIARAIAINAAREEGSNPESQAALGCLFMTVRWLGACLVPDEDWVILGYRHPSGEAEIRLPWSMLELNDPGLRFAIQTVWLFEKDTNGGEPQPPHSLNHATNIRTQVEQVTRRHLFATKQQKAPARRRAPDDLASHLPDLMTAERLADPKGGEPYGYLRLRAFEHDDVAEFKGEFRRLLGLLPRRGLVIDIRGNPGGIVDCAEGILQFLTHRRITPLPFQFLGSELIARISHPPPMNELPFGAALERLTIRSQWGSGIQVARETGASYSGGAALTSAMEANEIGQTYFGPVVLVVDAVTYSAGDIFAAGFQDHAIGPVLGTNGQTGGGGANVWPHDFLVRILPDVPEIKPLPGGAKLRVAARRCVRTGSFEGLPIEELGVRADELHRITEADVLEDNRDLKAAAMALIADQPARWLEAELVTDKNGRAVRVTATGLDRVDIYVDDRPLASLDVEGGGPAGTAVPKAWPAERVEVRGFVQNELKARRRLDLTPPPTS
jgi:hypothetical protein